jgi:hypothetical protein
MKQPANEDVKNLLQQINNIPDSQVSFDLWVPHILTLNGEPVTNDLAMAIVLDALLARGLFPDGFVEGEGGRLYRYRVE